MRQVFGSALTTILPILFQYCYKDCYSDSRNLWAVMEREVWRLKILFSRLFLLICLYQVKVIKVFTVFRLLTDFVCLYTYEFWMFLWKIVRSSVILLLSLSTWGMMAVICQLQDVSWWLSVSYMSKIDGYLSVTWGRLAVFFKLHEAGWCLYVSYMRQDYGYLSAPWGSLAVICLLHETRWRFSVSYMRQVGGYLLEKWRRRMVNCPIHEVGWRLYVS